MDGLSEQLLKNHFKLYEGYLKNTNDLVAKIASITPPSLEYSELSRRLGFEFCGMRMHEYYFENLCKGGKELDKSGKLSAKINDCFGSFDTWKKHFVETGKMRGVGWVALFQDPVNNCLYNVWIADHQTNIFVGCKPILVMDVWEHAFMLDYGLDRAKYIDVFFKNINWPEAEKRFTGCCQ
jgi:Fe-Mn family superoxide dismutase